MLGKFQNEVSQDRSSFKKINGLVYEIHFGSILRLPGKTLVCLAPLIGASFTITGFLIWLNKRKQNSVN
nr:PepSY-associated TM helix domain-containing protein [Algoriphagus sp.]